MSAELLEGDVSLGCLGIFVVGGDSELLVSLTLLARLLTLSFLL